jgi:hypothetical protein
MALSWQYDLRKVHATDHIRMGRQEPIAGMPRRVFCSTFCCMACLPCDGLPEYCDVVLHSSPL